MTPQSAQSTHLLTEQFPGMIRLTKVGEKSIICFDRSDIGLDHLHRTDRAQLDQSTGEATMFSTGTETPHRTLDYPKTRRRVEEALRKAQDPTKLVEITQILSVEISYEELKNEQPEPWEYAIADIMRKQDLIGTDLSDAILKDMHTLLPKRFTVFFGVDSSTRSIVTRYFLVESGVSLMAPDDSAPTRKVQQQKFNLFKMRGILLSFLKSTYTFSREEREKQLELWKICFNKPYPET